MISVTVDEGCQERSLFLAERWNINLQQRTDWQSLMMGSKSTKM